MARHVAAEPFQARPHMQNLYSVQFNLAIFGQVVAWQRRLLAPLLPPLLLPRSAPSAFAHSGHDLPLRFACIYPIHPQPHLCIAAYFIHVDDLNLMIDNLASPLKIR